MALKDELHNVITTQSESVTSYLTRVSQVKDEFAAVGKTILDSKIVRIALKGFINRWEVFVKCIVSRETSGLV